MSPGLPDAGTLNETMPPASLTFESGTSRPSISILPASAPPFCVTVIVPVRRGVPVGGICSIAHVPAIPPDAGAASLLVGVVEAKISAASASATNERNVVRAMPPHHRVIICTRRTPGTRAGHTPLHQFSLETRNS